ncbi:MAG: DNA glycosylase AlkZ-like family protein, partial [bacterium]
MLDRIARDGACTSADLAPGESRRSTGWWDWHPSKTALEYLWRTGRIAVARRDGFRKVYDLTERVIPAPHLAVLPDPQDSIGWACATALDRLGFATATEISAFWALATPAEA